MTEEERKLTDEVEINKLIDHMVFDQAIISGRSGKDKHELIKMIYWHILDKIGGKATALVSPELQKKIEKDMPEKFKRDKYRQLRTITRFPDIIKEFLPEFVSGKEHPEIKKGRDLKKSAAEAALKELLKEAKKEGKKKGRPEIF